MRIGWQLKFLRKNKLSSIIYNLFGTFDLHSQIRLKPLIKYCKENIYGERNVSVLELGCGCGVIGFELAQMNISMEYLGIDSDEDVINDAEFIQSKLNFGEQTKFVCGDITEMKIKENKKFDILILSDFIEHIYNPEQVLINLKSSLNEGCLLIISVPTINYLKYFGEKFNNSIGHIKREGYSITELEDMFELLNADLVTYSYNTGLISNLGCALFYRFIFENNKLEFVKSLLLYIFKYLDVLNNSKVSCTLFAVFKVK